MLNKYMEKLDCLNNAGIEPENVPGLQEVFKPDNEIANPFNGLKTKMEQKQYFQENFGLAVSVLKYSY